MSEGGMRLEKGLCLIFFLFLLLAFPRSSDRWWSSGGGPLLESIS